MTVFTAIVAVLNTKMPPHTPSQASCCSRYFEMHKAETEADADAEIHVYTCVCMHVCVVAGGATRCSCCLLPVICLPACLSICTTVRVIAGAKSQHVANRLSLARPHIMLAKPSVNCIQISDRHTERRKTSLAVWEKRRMGWVGLACSEVAGGKWLENALSWPPFTYAELLAFSSQLSGGSSGTLECSISSMTKSRHRFMYHFMAVVGDCV